MIRVFVVLFKASVDAAVVLLQRVYTVGSMCGRLWISH